MGEVVPIRGCRVWNGVIDWPMLAEIVTESVIEGLDQMKFKMPVGFLRAAAMRLIVDILVHEGGAADTIDAIRPSAERLVEAWFHHDLSLPF